MHSMSILAGVINLLQLASAGAVAELVALGSMIARSRPNLRHLYRLRMISKAYINASYERGGHVLQVVKQSLQDGTAANFDV